jgi:hypothetical protein
VAKRCIHTIEVMSAIHHLVTGRLYPTCRQNYVAEALQPAQQLLLQQQNKIDSSSNYLQRITLWRERHAIHYPLFRDSLALAHLMLGHPLFCVSRLSFCLYFFEHPFSSNTPSAESFFQDSSYIQNQSIAISLQSPASAPNTDTAPSNVLVPWRKSGFSRDVEFSDDSRSDRSDSDLSDSYVAPPIRNKRGFFNSKRLFTAFSKKTKAKFSFRNRQYQYLRGVELHEDPSVLSLSNSYSSQTKLMAQQLGQTPTNQPTASLGTFAAATLPFRPESVVPLEAGNEPTLEARSPQSPSNCVDQTGVVKSDSASAFSRSQFESSKGWSSCSRSSSSSDSSSDGSQWHNADLNGSVAEAIAIDGAVPSHTADIDVKDKIDLSRISSKSDSSESLEVSESSEVPEEEQSESFIETVHIMSIDSLAFSSSEDDIGHYASLLPHVVSHSSDEMSFLSFPSDEMTSVFSVLAALEDEVKTPQLQRVVPNDDDSDESSVEPASSNACAENVIAWAITNEMKKLEGSIPL